MPIVRSNAGIFYFCHIPKCGGTSIENYLHNSSGVSLAFLDRRFYWEGEDNPLRDWCSSSPQHVTGDCVDRLFPRGFFNSSFALIREPIERYKSAFYNAKYYDKFISEEVSINDFAANELRAHCFTQGWLDNHFMPQMRFIPTICECNVFLFGKVGFKNLKGYLDHSVIGSVCEEDFPQANESSSKFVVPNSEKEELSPQANELLHEVYNDDFKLYQKFVPRE